MVRFMWKANQAKGQPFEFGFRARGMKRISKLTEEIPGNVITVLIAEGNNSVREALHNRVVLTCCSGCRNVGGKRADFLCPRRDRSGHSRKTKVKPRSWAQTNLYTSLLPSKKLPRGLVPSIGPSNNRTVDYSAPE